MKLEIILSSIILVVGIIVGGILFFVGDTNPTKQVSLLAPEFVSPSGFINTEEGKPITLKELKGKVVLVDVWRYDCVNCKRGIPRINKLYEKYKDQGLEIVGLHTPQFAYERVKENVEKAVLEMGIKHPVVLDNEYGSWNAYGAQFWPTRYLINTKGEIIYSFVGDGGYEQTEQAIKDAILDI